MKKRALRQVPVSKELYIDAADFAEVPPRKLEALNAWRRRSSSRGYVHYCDEAIKNDAGRKSKLRFAVNDESTIGCWTLKAYKPKGVIHW